MTPREFRQEQEFEFDHFTELTSTGIKPNYVNIELFAHEYHKRKLKLLGIGGVSSSTSLPIDYCPKCKSPDIRQYTKTNDKCNNCNHAWYVYEPFKGVE